MRETNRLAELETFLSVADSGSFSAAARARGMTPSAVSKLMTRLEARLGTMLVRRSTRKLQLTDEGRRFATRAADILQSLEAAEREAGCADVAGVVRIATSSAYANHIMAPILGPLLRANPELDIGLVIGDRVNDLYQEPIDLAIRAGPLPDSSIIARSLGRSELIEVVGRDHLSDPVPIQGGFAYDRRDSIWAARPARLKVTDGNTLASISASSGIRVRLSRFVVAEALKSGQLVRCDQGQPKAYEDFHVLYLGQATTLPRRVAAVLDHIVRFGRVDRT